MENDGRPKRASERAVQTDADSESHAERILMASFTPQQPSVLLKHLSGRPGLVHGHIDTC